MEPPPPSAMKTSRLGSTVGGAFIAQRKASHRATPRRTGGTARQAAFAHPGKDGLVTITLLCETSPARMPIVSPPNQISPRPQAGRFAAKPRMLQGGILHPRGLARRLER